MTNRFNESFPSFILLYSEFSPRLRRIDNFSDCISFNVCNKENNDNHHAHQLDKLALEFSSSPSTAIIVTDASIKNDVATSISHTHTYNRPIIKMIHHVVHITSTEAELFVIRCSINQVLNLDNVSKVIVITDSIHIARKIFELSVYSYQVQSTAILSNLCKFFTHHENNSIEFWECSSCFKWYLHNEINKETKTFNLIILFPCKISWDFSKKSKSNTILELWKMMFQASNLKENQFLDLLDEDNNIIEPTYVKGGSWLKIFGHSNSLCACATRAIINHALIDEYRLRFFPRKEFKYLCGVYPIESKYYILHECGRFNSY